jgi:hypothetical protein
MSNLSREVEEYMASIGAVREGHTGGDHIRYRLPNGKPYFTSLTPSDSRALRNIRSETRRILGISSEGGKKAASYGRKVETSGFSIEAAKREQQHSAAIREITARATANVIRIDSLLIEAQRRRDVPGARNLIEQLMANKATLERYYQPMPTLTCKLAALQEVA